MAMTSPPSSTPLAFRQYVTLTRPDLLQGRVVEYPPTPGRSDMEETSKDSETNDPSCGRESSAFKVTLNKGSVATVAAFRDSPRGDSLPHTDATVRSKPWPTSSSSNQHNNSNSNNNYAQKKRLETMNFKKPRKSSRGSITQCGVSSKRSDSTNNDSQRSAVTSESTDQATRSPGDNVPAAIGTSPEVPQAEVALTEEELEKRRNIEKCMNWIEKLPAKFSGMHIAQERAPVTND
ncbi:uncharacterized protein LOC101855620 [Aplysia californica]|uniref:Uncharacterized protein LOC101855620 n=1 Tax=Aplysia californica TaxID=6500 RepID=A0ABM0JDY9_APLCA|nr:uncharacterized protein LOC101855620 [Aplysia californica]XP_005091486.1 uncharacterized protein LOC101855620 [Aplysia californica]